MSDPLFFDNNSSNNRLMQKLKSMNPYIIGILSIGMLFIITLSIWAFYPSEKNDLDSLPVIYAEKQPARIKPDEQITENSADYNSRIYNTFGQNTPPQRIENLLKPQDHAEQPLPKEELFAGIRPEIKESLPENNTVVITDSPKIVNSPSQSELEDSQVITDTPLPQSPDNKIAVDITVTEKKPVPGIFANNVPENNPEDDDVSGITEQIETPQKIEETEPAAGLSTAANEIKTAATNEIKPQQNGTHYVQLASIKDQAQTTTSWSKLTMQHSDLKNVTYRTESADIAGKGTFYRIQAGPFSKQDAEKLCEKIKSQFGSCFVTSK